MLGFFVRSEGFTDIRVEWPWITPEGVDFTPLAAEVEQILFDDVREQRRLGMGLDESGSYGDLAPIKPSTIKRRERGKDGDGPPLAPNYDGSRIANPHTESEAIGPGQMRVSASWPGLDWLVYHLTGTDHMPVRNPVYLSEAGWLKVGEAAERFLLSLIGR